MKKLLLIILFLAFLGIGGWSWKNKQNKREDIKQQMITVSEGSIRESVESTGFVSPLNRVEIKPPISGRIEKLLVNEGDHVKEGEILAWMSSSDRAAILDAARAQGPDALKHWEDAYKPTPIVAPLSGVIILRNVVVGQTVDPSAVLFAMSDTLIVTAQVDESDIGRVYLGMPAEVTLDSYPNQPVQGRVFDILYEGKNVSNVITYGVKVRTSPIPSFFRSQMTANISFIVSSKENALLIPVSVVRELSNGSKQVSIPGSNGKSIARDITTGIESNDKIEVTSGLQAGDQVIVIRGKYIPQQAPQSSPLTFGGKSSGSSSGQPARYKKS